ANSAACCTSVNFSGVGSLGSAVEGGGASAATESPRDRAVRQGRRRVSSRSLHKGTARAGGWFKRVLFLSPAGSGGAARGPGRRARRRPYGGVPDIRVRSVKSFGENVAGQQHREIASPEHNSSCTCPSTTCVSGRFRSG